MTPETITAVATLAVAIAVILVLVAVLVLVARKAFGSLQFKAGPISVDLQARLVEMADQVKQINDTVNHRTPDERTLRERIIKIENDHEWTKAAIVALGTHVGCELPPPLPGETVLTVTMSPGTSAVVSPPA